MSVLDGNHALMAVMSLIVQIGHALADIGNAEMGPNVSVLIEGWQSHCRHLTIEDLE